MLEDKTQKKEKATKKGQTTGCWESALRRQTLTEVKSGAKRATQEMFVISKLFCIWMWWWIQSPTLRIKLYKTKTHKKVQLELEKYE